MRAAVMEAARAVRRVAATDACQAAVPCKLPHALFWRRIVVSANFSLVPPHPAWGTLSYTLTLALTTSRPTTNHACLHRGDQLIWVLLPVELNDLCRLEEGHGTAGAALFAPAAPPPVLADAAAAALLAFGALPPVLADAAAAAVLADTALPSVVADATAATVLALLASPPVLTNAAPATILAPAALPPVLANAAAATVLALAAMPPVLADAAAAALLAGVAPPPVLADAAAAAVLADAALPSVLTLLPSHVHARPASPTRNCATA